MKLQMMNFTDLNLKKRYLDMFTEKYCPMCPNQSISTVLR